MTVSIAERITLAVASILLILAVVGAFVGATEAEDGASALAASPTPFEGDGGDAGVPDDASTGPAGTRAPVATATPATTREPIVTASPGGPVATGPVSPTPLEPPEAGTYRYRVRTGDDEETRQTVIEDVGDGQQREKTDGGSDAFGDGTNHVVWRPDGKIVERTTFGSGDNASECDWEPDVLEYPRPLEVGSSWEVDSSCEMSQQGFTFSFHLEGSFAVTGAERTQVAGATLDVWVVEGEATFTFSAPGQESGSLEIDSRELVSGEHGLTVRSTEHSEGSFGGDSQQNTTNRELLNLDPE